MIVWPAHLMVTPPPEATVFVLAPTCRYGVAAYGVYFYHKGELSRCRLRFNWREASRTVGSGASLRVRIPDGWEDAEIRLRLQAIVMYSDAFLDATPEEFTVALTHPLREVREQALLDMAGKRSE
jgi:hypothetical protein